MAKKKSSIKQIEKQINKVNSKVFIASFLFLIIGLIFGVSVCYILTKNDEFVINGDKEITINVGETYTEEGAKAILFGKDISNDIVIEGEVDTTTAGTYRIKYTCDNFKYKNIVRFRYITVLEVE